MILVEIASKNRERVFHINNLIENVDWYILVNDPFIKISYANREFLKGAYSLAKQGKDKVGVLSAWC